MLVKTKEEGLDIIKDARQLFYGNPDHMGNGLEQENGFDQERMVKYAVTAAGGFQWQGVPVKVAHVKETFLKPKPGRLAETQYWVVTTDQTLSAGDLREIARLRWHIENLTFRRLSQLIDSKRRSTASSHTHEALLGLWFIGLNLLELSLAFTRMLCPDQAFKATFGTAKKTIRWFTKLFDRITLLEFVSQTS